MSVDNEFDRLRKIAENIEVQPPSSSWKKLEKRLYSEKKSRKNKRQSGIRFLMSMAAVFIVLIIAVTVLQNMSSNISEVQRGTIVDWEELDTNADFFYSVEQIRQLNSAYSKLVLEGTSLNPVNFGDGLSQDPG